MEKATGKKVIKNIVLTLLLFIVVFIVVFLFFNFMFNIIYEVFQKTFKTGSILEPDDISVGLYMLTDFSSILATSIIFLVIVFFSFISSMLLVFKIKANYGSLNKNQKGSSRFTTLKEIQQQYRDVPDKAKRYKGSGGVPIARYKDRLYIDDSPVNNLIIGTTRSGKGETIVFSTIDVYSRAEEQASMIINDPKGELFSASKEQLERLGYHVEVLNLMTPEQSMSYNLLNLTVDAFVNEDYSLAEQYARAIGFMMFHDPHAKDPVWWKSSASLCTALILGLCEQCKDEPEKITMYNVALMLSDLGSREVENEKGEMVSALDDFFSRFPSNHPAKLQFATVNFSSGQMRASILANTNSELDAFTTSGIAKLTSKSTFDTDKVGFNRWIKGKAHADRRIYIKFPNGKEETTRTNSDGVFTIYHDNKFSTGDKLIIRCDTTETEIEVREKILNKKNDGRKVFEGNYNTTSSNDGVEIIELMQFEKPVAIFMVTPDYDETFNFIVSIFIKQVYSNLSRIASNTLGGQCQREVVFLLDEFGNMPAIESFSNIITVCLGRKIRFNLVIQAYSQLEEKYGDSWKTIDGNCGNTIYLLTADEDTAERVSKQLGETTITTKSRTGSLISLNKSRTESPDQRRLMTATEVMGLKEGEALIIRVIKRQDKKRKRIQSHPIYLTGKTALKYRWEYLSDFYDTSKNINQFDIYCEHTTLNLDDLKVDFKFNNYEMRNKDEKEKQNAIDKEESTENQLLKHTETDVSENFNEHVNKRVKTKDIIQKGLLLQAFDNDMSKVDKYNEMGLMDFRDVVISNSEDMSEKWCSILMGKIDSALNKIKNEIGKEED